MILKYTVLILVLIKITLSYRHYEYLELLCPEQKYKEFFEKFTNNIPEVKLGQVIESAALINYRSNGIYLDGFIWTDLFGRIYLDGFIWTNHKKIGSCKFDVKVDVGSGNGIFASIKNLKLRENTNASYGEDSCVDYIRFTYKNGTSTTPICGNVETSVHNNLIRNFFDETSGEMRVEVFINSENSLSSSETIVVYLVLTAYSRCYDNSSQLKCSTEKCISDVFMNDTILNCPPPGCSDESECVNNEKLQVVIVKTRSSSSVYIIPIVVVILVAIIGLLSFCKKKIAATNKKSAWKELRLRYGDITTK